jgi:hypothetical protein
MLVSYVFYQCKDLFAPLAARLDTDPMVKVRFIVDLSHQRESPAEPLNGSVDHYLACGNPPPETQPPTRRRGTKRHRSPSQDLIHPQDRQTIHHPASA